MKIIPRLGPIIAPKGTIYSKQKLDVAVICRLKIKLHLLFLTFPVATTTRSEIQRRHRNIIGRNYSHNPIIGRVRGSHKSCLCRQRGYEKDRKQAKVKSKIDESETHPLSLSTRSSTPALGLSATIASRPFPPSTHFPHPSRRRRHTQPPAADTSTTSTIESLTITLPS